MTLFYADVDDIVFIASVLSTNVVIVVDDAFVVVVFVVVVGAAAVGFGFVVQDIFL